MSHRRFAFFAWRVATNSLAVQVNRVVHHQTTFQMCTICGMEDESTFHALVMCPKAVALRMTMRDIWELPTENVFRYTGYDWFIVLLSQLKPVMRYQSIFIFWRVWHLRNDLIFGKGKESVSASASFVGNYWASFAACHSMPPVDSKNKGKCPMDGLRWAPDNVGAKADWTPPPTGFLKINVDSSFVESIRETSVGVVVRNAAGEVIVSSWDFIGSCQSVEETVLRACIAGLYIGIPLHNPIILETDCAFVVATLATENLDRSSLVDLKKEALSLSKLINNFQMAKISRSANVVAHLIAKFSFDNRSDGILVNDVPPCVVNFVSNDCKFRSG